MIGGHDISYNTQAPPEVMEGALRIVLAIWPEAVVENAETGELLGHDLAGLQELPQEAFVYKDKNARDSWTQHGATAENENRMVHVLRGTDSITFVVDDPGAAEMSTLLAAIRQHVYQDIFWLRAHAA